MTPARIGTAARLVVLLPALSIVGGTSVAGQDGRGEPTEVEAASQSWSAPRTPFGHPDLQGVWVNKRATPFERPEALQGRESLTEAEVAELERRADRIFWGGRSDLVIGDGLFLTVLDNPERFTNPNGANRSSGFMVEREFDARTSLIVDPPEGQIPALTPVARQRQATARMRARTLTGPESFHSRARCITQGVPRIGPGPGGDPLYGYQQIFQTPDQVVLLMEAFHDARIIPLDGRRHLSPRVRQWHGDSRGRWEGDTLVVTTENFSRKSSFLGSADNLRMVERLTRVSADTIEYEITLDDPTTWTTTPWTAIVYLTLTTDRIYEYGCHEGNEDPMRSMLGIARMEEKAEGRQE